MTGENFNVFKLLGMASKEVKTHTAFITELLNPRGSHQQETVFLKLFIDQFQIKDFHMPSAQVFAEYYIGAKTDTTGGRIDLVLSDANGSRIFIENKIYASDQENQLLRYYNYDRGARLFYLTLNGDPASERSTGKELDESHYSRISYRTQLLEWLEGCKKEAVNLPILRETLTQYIHLIKDLTNQTINHKMQDETVQQILRDKESLRSFFTIAEAYDQVISQLFINLGESLKLIASDLGLTLEYDLSERAYSGFSFREEELNKANLMIRFEFEKNSAQNFFFGLCYIDPTKKSETPAQFGLLFKSSFGETVSTDFWHAWAWWQEYRYWNADTYLQVHSGVLAAAIKEKVIKTLEVINIAKQ